MLRKTIELTPKNVAQFLQSYDHFLFDCDGVLWRGQENSVPKAEKFVNLLRELVKYMSHMSGCKNAKLISFLSKKKRKKTFISSPTIAQHRDLTMSKN